MSNAEMFSKFFEQWVEQQQRDLDALRSAAASGHRSDDAHGLRSLIDDVLSHYEHYYSGKSAAAAQDVVPMFSPSWTTPTENLFMWVGGWRPSVAFHLLYSKSGHHLDSLGSLDSLIRGLPTHDLADLSPHQLDVIDRLHRRTVELEREISEEEAAAQEAVADARMVELAAGAEEEAMGEEMGKKEEEMRRVLERADRLRMDTLRGVVQVLRPMQAVHFLIAAAELHLSVHDYGKRKDVRA